MKRHGPRNGSLPRVRLKNIEADSEVGYGRPPKSTRFKPGESGNPKGRPKGSKNESTILKKILQHKIAIRGSSGRIRKISVLEGIHRKVAEDALKGNVKSAGFMLNRYAALVSGELKPQDMGEDDRAVLEAFVQQTIAQKSREQD